MQNIKTALSLYGIECSVLTCNNSPSVTSYYIQLADGSKIRKLQNSLIDIARTIKAKTITIGGTFDGIVRLDVAGGKRQIVGFAGLLEADTNNMELPVIIGKDVENQNVVLDMVDMPHMLISGQTGSGKSVSVHAIIAGLLFKKGVDNWRGLFIDPKIVEFNVYKNLPNLKGVICNDLDNTIEELDSLIDEMNYRYSLFAETGCRNLREYNSLRKLAGMNKLEYIVVFIDELADLILSSGIVEEQLIILLQKARASGIHLIMATQRPSRDVITGLINANVDCRLCLRVGSAIDSRVALGVAGAEALLGKGDGLLRHNGEITRIQAPYIDNESLIDIVNVVAKANRKV